MLNVREAYKLLRWRFVPVRYLGKLSTYVSPRRLSLARTVADACLLEHGYDKGPTLSPELLREILAIYAPRVAEVVPTTDGHPFQNLFRPEDLSADNPVFRLAFSPEVLDRADGYFGSKMRFDSIQYVYSWPTEGRLRESQFWHRDYGDSKSFHCITYMNDVVDPVDGPFMFVDRADTARIHASPFIRRIPDDKFLRELGDGEVRSFYGKAGESVVVDPSACYHYGSRCKNPRSAVFVTFTTHRPFVDAQPMIRGHEQRALEEARKVRPDLAESYLRQILGA